MTDKLIPELVRKNYTYKETYIAGATNDIPLTYEINIFKHKTENGKYCATEIKTQTIEYGSGLTSEYLFRSWAKNFHFVFSDYPREVERRMKRQGLDMYGCRLTQ
ncbi:hypothetical protein D1872_264580 [compost metagenome]